MMQIHCLHEGDMDFYFRNFQTKKKEKLLYWQKEIIFYRFLIFLNYFPY